MYENNYKNPIETNLKDLENFLQLLADLDTDIELFAMGGTAMVLKHIKEATKDIDFLTTLNYETMSKLLRLAGLDEKSNSQLCNIWYMKGDIRIDIFYNDFIIGITLPEDWKKLSEHIRTIGRLKVYILNWFDIIITKLARSESRDITDALIIIRSQKLDFQQLKKRYYEVAPVSIYSDYDIKFKHLEEKFHAKK